MWMSGWCIGWVGMEFRQGIGGKEQSTSDLNGERGFG